MKFAVFLFSFISSLIFHPVSGQNSQTSEKKYKEAVGYYLNGNYAQAMQHLAPLTQVQHQSSGFSPYAHYYYALAAIKAKKAQDGYLMARQLTERFPSWEKINDAYYVLGLAQFEKKSYADALRTVGKIKNANLIKDAQGLKQNYLLAITDLNTLKLLQKEFPEDREVAFATASLIQAKYPTKDNLQLVTQLNAKFGGKKPASNVASEKESKETTGKGRFDKDYFNVAVLLPFRLDQAGSSNHLRSSQYIIDYYQGLQLAQKQLSKEGISINLLPYDISNDPGQLQSFYNTDKEAPSDLLIGPLYPKTYDDAVKYSKKNKSYVLNPFATDGSLIADNGNVFLAHPSMQFQASEMAKFTRTLGSDINLAVYYGTSVKDSIMAAHYVNEIKAARGRVLEMKKIGQSAEEINNSITIDEDKQPTQVILFSSASNTGTSLMNILSGRKLSHLKVISVASAFNMQNNMSSFASRVYLADADFADLDNPSIRQFQKKYFEATNTLPSVFSYQGYDQLLYFGRMMYRYKDKLPEGVSKKSDSKDFLLSGFDYSGNSRENKRFPILKNQEGQWAQVN